MRRERLAALERCARGCSTTTAPIACVLAEVDRRIHELRHELEEDPYTFDRRFLFRVLSMGHSQFAELIGARGPNTQINAACASTTQAVALAEDWIRAGRCRRVADRRRRRRYLGHADGLDRRRLPGDRRGRDRRGGRGRGAAVRPAPSRHDHRHGRRRPRRRERRRRPRARAPADLRGARLGDGEQRVPRHAARRRPHRPRDGATSSRRPRPAASRREEIAGETVFVSHETYTPARGGSAAAEIHALRQVFGDERRSIVIANTKGFTGHPMGVGIEDVVAVKALETGIVPPVPNFKRARSRAGRSSTSRRAAPTRSATRCGWRPASARRSRCAAALDAGAPTAARRTRTSSATTTGSPTARRGAAWLRRASGYDDRSSRSCSTGCASSTKARPAARAAPKPCPHRRMPSRAGGRSSRQPWRREPRAGRSPRRPAAAATSRSRSGAGDRRRADRLPAGPAGPRPRSRGRPRDRHGQAGRGVRGDPRGLRDRARRHAEAARLPDAQPRRRVRPNERAPAVEPQPAPGPLPLAEPAPRRRCSPRRAAPAEAPAAARGGGRRRARCSASSPSRPAIRRTCWTWISISRPISGSTRSSRPRCSRRSARPYGIERDDTLKLRDYPTLNHVVGFVHERATTAVEPQPAAGAAPAPEPAPRRR